MTSFVLSPRTLERAYKKAIFDGFWGIWTPNVVGHRVDPKRHFLTPQRVFWDISREIPCTGCFSRRVREKNTKERPYISRISPGAPLRPIGTNFGLRVRLVDVISCANFYRNRLRGLDLWGSNFDHSHWIAISPLTLCELLFTLWCNLDQQVWDNRSMPVHTIAPSFSRAACSE